MTALGIIERSPCQSGFARSGLLRCVRGPIRAAVKGKIPARGEPPLSCQTERSGRVRPFLALPLFCSRSRRTYDASAAAYLVLILTVRSRSSRV